MYFIINYRLDQNLNLAEDAVKYAIFLVDADKLFDVALGMYDFSLVLLVAQQSQKVILIYYSIMFYNLQF